MTCKSFDYENLSTIMTRFYNLNLDIELNRSDRKTDDKDLDWLTDKDQGWQTTTETDCQRDIHTEYLTDYRVY